ncbi:MAG: hypothetical protein LUG55_07320 [Clostridiales bacterium]|nr:hypothetical protein [Clostridiales bacterium]
MSIQIILMIVLTVAACFRCDDYYTRTTPYAIVSNSQEEDNEGTEYVQVIVYQNTDIIVLEQAKIEPLVDGTEKLTIDTSKQEIVQDTTLSYEYCTFSEVELNEVEID